LHEKVSAAARETVRIGLGRVHSRITQRPKAFGFCGKRVRLTRFVQLQKPLRALCGDPVALVDAAAACALGRLDPELSPK
jgi:hypothetical protein